MTNYLDTMKFPKDIKLLNIQELEQLAKEIRSFLIDSVSVNGGHLASNLGVVELTISLFKTFNLEEDKIIYDVGHQSYVHKILTGRKDQFCKLRKRNGLSGFPKRSESIYDAFDTGHSSTSISAALGMARARDIQNKDYYVVAVIGDGALNGGLALEALNDVGFRKTNLIIILNDNQMSISNNVGGLSKHLNNLRMDPAYNKLKADINNTLGNSDFGKSLIYSINKIKDSIKQLVVPSMLFEDMGIKYLGPIDGHDIEKMNEVFNTAKKIAGPVIIHTVTKKGKGYEFSEESPEKFHGVAPFDKDTGEVLKKEQETYSKAFGSSMVKLAKEDSSIVAVTAAMPSGTGLVEYSKAYPDRFFDVGIAEEHAVTMCSGMAASGIKPVFAVYSTFLQRSYDQILHDVCIQKLPVVLAIDRAGIVGNDGETHQGIMDISYLSAMPNMTIVAPKCIKEMELLLRYALDLNMPIAIRYPKGHDIIEIEPRRYIKYGKWEILNRGDKLAVISVGKMTQFAMKAINRLKEEGIDITLINATFIKPLDLEILKELSDNNYNIITVEDNEKIGGFGSYVLNALNDMGYTGKLKMLAYDDMFIPQGSLDELYREYGLDDEGIYRTIKQML